MLPSRSHRRATPIPHAAQHAHPFDFRLRLAWRQRAGARSGPHAPRSPGHFVYAILLKERSPSLRITCVRDNPEKDKDRDSVVSATSETTASGTGRRTKANSLAE